MNSFDPSTENLADILRVLVKRKWGIAALTALAMASALVHGLLSQKIYEAEASFLITSSKSGGGLGAFFSAIPELGAGSSLINQFLGGGQAPSVSGVNLKAILESKKLARAVYSRKEIYKQYEALAKDPEFDLDGLVRKAAESIEVDDETAGVISFTVEAPGDKLVKQVADAYCEELIHFVKNQMKTSSGVTHDFIQSQLEQTTRDLADSELRLRAFEESEKVFAIEPQTQKAITNYAELEKLLWEARFKLTESNNMIAKLGTAIPEQVEYLAPNPELVELRGSLIQKQIEFEQIKGIMDKKSANYKRIQEELTTLKNRLDAEMKKVNLSENERLQTEKIVAEKTIELIQTNLDSMDRALEKLPDQKLNYVRLKRENEIQNVIYAMLRQQLETAKVDMAREQPPIETLDGAEVPEFRVKPRIKLNMLIAGAVMLFISSFAVFLGDYMRRLSEGAGNPA